MLDEFHELRMYICSNISSEMLYIVVSKEITKKKILLTIKINMPFLKIFIENEFVLT